MQSWTIPSPGRLDAFVAGQLPFLSRARAQKLIQGGNVSVNGNVVTKAAQRLVIGDRVALEEVVEERTSALEPRDLRLRVLYEDSASMVIEKPAGLAVHPAPGISKDEATLLHGIAHLFRERSLPFSEDAVLVHRLDRETTGCLLVAKTREAHDALQKQFARRSVCKIYLALVAGVPSPPSAMIEAPVGRSLTDRTKMAVLRTGKSREAATTYRTRTATEQCALLECDLHTGRTHQIRVHLAAVGHPVLGDPAYSSPVSEKLSKQYEIPGLCLHAWMLRFVSPADQKEHEVTAPLSTLLRSALERVGIRF